MAYTTTAKAFVARALQNQLTAVGRLLVRQDKPKGNTGSEISPGVVAGIAIGCASFVLLAILAVVVPILYIRYLKRLDKDKRRMAARDTLNPNDDLHTTLQPHTSLRQSILMPHNPSAAWGALPSQEDISVLSIEQTQQEQRKPGLLSWPNSRRSWKKKQLQAKRARQFTLSAIHENHQASPGVESGITGELEATFNDNQTSLGDEATSEEVQAPREATTDAMTESAFQRNPVHGRSASDTFSASDLIPTLDEGEREVRFSTFGNRSRSNSTMFANFSQEMGFDNSPPQTQERRVSRTSSLRSKIGTAPDEPLPPLPSNLERVRPQTQDTCFRRESALSASTIDSTATSIMDPPPPQSESESLPQRHEPTTTGFLDGKTGNEFMSTVARDPSTEHDDPNQSYFAPPSSSSRTKQILSLNEAPRYSMGSRNNRPRAKTATSLPEGDVAGEVSIGDPPSSATQAEAFPHNPSLKRSSQIRKSKSAADLTEEPNSLTNPNHSSTEDGESVQQFVQTLGAGSSPGSLFQWVLQAVGKKTSPKSSPGPAQLHDGKGSGQGLIQPTYTTASFNPLPYRRVNHLQEEPKSSNASQLKQSGIPGPKPSLEERNSGSSSKYHSHQTSSASKSPGRSFETSDDLREGTDTTVSNSIPNGRHNKNLSSDWPSIGGTSSASEEVGDVSRPRQNAGPIWSSSPDSSNLSEVTWSSSPPLPRNQIPPLPSAHSKTKSASRLSYLPVASMSQPRPPPGSRIPRKPTYGPPRSQPSTTPPATRVLRPMTADARINRSHMRGYQQNTPVDQQGISERLNAHDRNYSDDKENDRHRRGGGVWTGLDDLEDFWGTSERKDRAGMFATNKRTVPLSRTGNNKPVSREGLGTRHTTPSDDAEGDTSFEDDNNFF